MAFDGYGMPSVDFSPLGKLGDIYQQNKTLGTRERLLSELGNGASLNDIALALFRANDPQSAQPLAQLANTQSQNAATNAYHQGMLKVLQDKEAREANAPQVFGEEEPYTREQRKYILRPKTGEVTPAVPRPTIPPPEVGSTDAIVPTPVPTQSISAPTAAPPAAPKPRNDVLFNSLPPFMQTKVQEVLDNPELIHDYKGKEQETLANVVRGVQPGWQRPQMGVLTPETIDVNARRLYLGDYSPLTGLSRGTSGPNNLAKVWNQFTNVLTKEKGFTPDEAAQIAALKKQEFDAQAVALKQAGRTKATREENLNLIIKATEAAIPAALAASQDVYRTGFVPLNKIVQAGGTIVASNPAERRFGMANLQLAEHWARAMNPLGIMRESDRDLALHFLNTADSPQTYTAAVDQLKKQIDREYEGVRRNDPSRSEQLIAETRKRVEGGPSSAQPPAPAPGGAIPPPPAGFQLVR